MTVQITSSLVSPDSLAETLDRIHLQLFLRDPMPEALREEAARWLADRQGLPGSYAGMFAPTGYDNVYGAQTFTGEPLRSGASTGHVLSEEALAALFRLNVPLPEVQAAIHRARRALFRRVEQGEVKGQWSGVYCCGLCSAALWRHLASSGQADDFRRLEHGLFELQRHRDGQGRWKRFPYYYTLLALSEVDLPAARLEGEYAAPGIERALKRAEKTLGAREETEQERRRRIIMGRILEKC